MVVYHPVPRDLLRWGGNGWGNNNGGGATDGYILASDFANIERKLDGVNNGLCDGFYGMNTSVLNGFAGVTQAVNSGSRRRSYLARTSKPR